MSACLFLSRILKAEIVSLTVQLANVTVGLLGPTSPGSRQPLGTFHSSGLEMEER